MNLAKCHCFTVHQKGQIFLWKMSRTVMSVWDFALMRRTFLSFLRRKVQFALADFLLVLHSRHTNKTSLCIFFLSKKQKQSYIITPGTPSWTTF